MTRVNARAKGGGALPELENIVKTKPASPRPRPALIQFRALIGFCGSKTQFRKVTSSLKKLSKDGLMIGTQPLPENPLSRYMIGPWIQPEKPLPPEIGIAFLAEVWFSGTPTGYRRVSASLERLRTHGLMIGTWPTPESPLGKHLTRPFSASAVRPGRKLRKSSPSRSRRTIRG